jgi:hypothetical protein
MTSRLAARLDRVERIENPEPRGPLEVYVWGNADEAEAVSAARLSRSWPDDGDHPVRVTRFRWQGTDDEARGIYT